MGLRKAAVYKAFDRPFTRKSRVKGKDFIKAVPQLKVVKFSMGNVEKYNNNKFPFIMKMVAGIDMQVRDNALESSRQIILRHLEGDVGDFYFSVAVYPHHVLREHKMAAVAQSDRIFAGMSHAYGKPVSIAARINKGKDIFIVAVSSKAAVSTVRKIFDMTRSKIGSTVSVVTEEIKIAEQQE